MTAPAIVRLALASLAPVLAIAAAPALAQDDGNARVPGNRYLVLNQTGAPLACRYRVIPGTPYSHPSVAWEDAGTIAAGAAFSRTVQGAGEMVSLDCNLSAEDAKPFVVRPGSRYGATRADDGKVVIARVRA